MPQEHMLNRQGWCAHQYNEADFIIMCVSEQYKTEIDMYECESQIDDKELHIQFIYSLMLAELKQNGNKNSRVIPLLFKGCTEVNIPQWLEHTYVYTWPGQYRDLLWCLTKPHTRIKLQSQRNHSTSTSHVNGPHSI
ncbi:E3 ubiquitin ligase TRAF3IP2-like [Mytilus trossulus]|uniref:E3 ubiquitin ligase TRAF3IP2-like n=1 Tax=Mytilus trossulus TaxID=6551 RepID=UPI003005D600